MNNRLLLYKKIIIYSDWLLVIMGLLLALYIYIWGFDTLFHQIMLTILAITMLFLSYISSIRSYRYTYKRKMTENIVGIFGLVHVCTVLTVVFLSFLSNALQLSMISFINGVVFIFLSHEIKRAYSLGFEHCGNWKIRRVLGILLMLPLPLYALIYFLD